MLVSQPGHYLHPRLSPDGKQLALEVGTGGATEIYIFDIASGTSLHYHRRIVQH